jgi:hypothetical protein
MHVKRDLPYLLGVQDSRQSYATDLDCTESDVGHGRTEKEAPPVALPCSGHSPGPDLPWRFGQHSAVCH